MAIRKGALGRGLDALLPTAPHAVLGIGGLVASVVFGLLWTAFGPTVAFGAGATISLLSTVLLFAVVRR